MDIDNGESSANRETLSAMREPTWRGPPVVPEKQFIGKMDLKNNPTYEPNLHLPNLSTGVVRANFEYAIKKNDTQQNAQIFDPEFLNIMGHTLQQNPLVNNIVYRGKNNNNDTYMFEYTQK